MLKSSLNSNSDLDDSINNHHILGDFIFFPCPVDKEYCCYFDLSSLENSNDNIPDDLIFIPGPRF